jgi:hypothetical protein
LKFQLGQLIGVFFLQGNSKSGAFPEQVLDVILATVLFYGSTYNINKVDYQVESDDRDEQPSHGSECVVVVDQVSKGQEHANRPEHEDLVELLEEVVQIVVGRTGQS